MKSLPFLLFIAAPGAVSAHSGHLVDVAGAGHDHWVAGAALGTAAAITLWAALKGKKKEENAVDENAETDDSSEPQEA
ncbi:MAG: DUF6732 family protein [Pseudoruegeria sp.]